MSRKDFPEHFTQKDKEGMTPLEKSCRILIRLPFLIKILPKCVEMSVMSDFMIEDFFCY